MKKFFAFFLICLISVPSLSAYADNNKKKVILGTVNNLPPFSYIEDGKLTGIDIDLFRELEKRLEIELTIKEYPWARILLHLKSGKIDGAFSAYLTEERKNFCIYTDVMHYDELYLAVKKDKRFPFSEITDLYGKTIGKGKAVFISVAFSRGVEEGKIIVEVLNDMNMSNIKKLNMGRLDAVVGSPDTMMYYAKKLGVEKEIVLLEKPLRKRIPAYLVLSKASRLENIDGLGQKITATLKEMRKEGTLKKISELYTGRYIRTGFE